jgi:hypothetical protein
LYSSVEITFLVWFCFCEATILWGRRLAWNKLRLESFGTIKVAMFNSHFSANSSLFSFLGKNLLKLLLAEGDKDEKTNNKLPSLRQNNFQRSLGKTEHDKQQNSQVPGVR